jgi:phospholipid transport system transporter-binding protein
VSPQGPGAVPAFEFGPSGPGTFAVRGAMTFATAAPLHAAGLAALGASPEARLALDCAGVGDADSAGLVVLVDWLAWARAAGKDLQLRNVPPKLLDIARISELDELLVPA